MAGAKLAEVYAKLGVGSAAGLGRCETETKCDAVRVYLTATGAAGKLGLPQRAVTLMAPAASPADVLERANALFGADAAACDGTAHVCDSSGFRLDEERVELRHLSNNCTLALAVVPSAESTLLRWPSMGGDSNHARGEERSGGTEDSAHRGDEGGGGGGGGGGNFVSEWREKLLEAAETVAGHDRK